MSRRRSVLILHGWGGNKPEHWQELAASALVGAGMTVHYPRMPEPAAPSLGNWLARLREEAQVIGDDPTLTVLCHSLGAITWMHYAASVSGRVADRVLLVAPPYVMPAIPPIDAPAGVASFFPPPMDAAAIARAAAHTIVVASDNDDYATFEQARTYAQRLQVPAHLLAGAGHISPYWGYGEWPWVVEWCLGRAGLPPRPRPVGAAP